MKLGLVGNSLFAGILLAAAGAHDASAGGLFLPGSGAVSTARAGAAVASADDGEALALNPAGLAKAKGNTITISAAMISYAMEFTRRGTYDDIANQSYAFEGMNYQTMKNDVSPDLGIGSMQPIPVVAFITDLGGRVKGLHLAAGLYAPNAYPFRDMCGKGAGGCTHFSQDNLFSDFNVPPPSTRYDIMQQDAKVMLPSVAVAYRIMPELDVGLRMSAGFAKLKSTTAIWGMPANVTEDLRQDAAFTVDAKDNFVPAWGFGVTYRPTPAIELGANYTSQISMDAKGTAASVVGPDVTLNGNTLSIGPTDDRFARCATGGTVALQKACVNIDLPMTATVGGRYKFLGADGREKGDLELNVGWENWSTDRASNYRVVVDADVYVNGASALSLHDNIVRHGLQDTYAARLGGSYHIPVSANDVILRGGLGYDTAAAKTGWLRADIDGAARTTVTAGGAFRTNRWEINVGGGAILEGSPSNPGTCNPTSAQPNMLGCNGDGVEHSPDQRQGPDPINPLVVSDQQTEAPTNRGTFKSHYVLAMLGFTTWF